MCFSFDYNVIVFAFVKAVLFGGVSQGSLHLAPNARLAPTTSGIKVSCSTGVSQPGEYAFILFQIISQFLSLTKIQVHFSKWSFVRFLLFYSRRGYVFLTRQTIHSLPTRNAWKTVSGYGTTRAGEGGFEFRVTSRKTKRDETSRDSGKPVSREQVDEKNAKNTRNDVLGEVVQFNRLKVLTRDSESTRRTPFRARY